MILVVNPSARQLPRLMVARGVRFDLWAPYNLAGIDSESKWKQSSIMKPGRGYQSQWGVMLLYSEFNLVAVVPGTLASMIKNTHLQLLYASCPQEIRHHQCKALKDLDFLTGFSPIFPHIADFFHQSSTYRRVTVIKNSEHYSVNSLNMDKKKMLSVTLWFICLRHTSVLSHCPGP